MKNILKCVLLIAVLSLVSTKSEAYKYRLPKFGYGLSYYPKYKYAAEKFAVDINYKHRFRKIRFQYGLEANCSVNKIRRADFCQNDVCMVDCKTLSKADCKLIQTEDLGRSYGISGIFMSEFSHNLYLGVKLDAVYLDPRFQNPYNINLKLAFQVQYDFFESYEYIVGAVGTISNNYYQIGMRVFI